MKKLIALLLTLTLMTCTTAMAADIEMGIGLGGLNIDGDLKTKETFGKDFFWTGYMALRGNTKFSLRGNLGFFSNMSHHPDDIGDNLRLGITELTASLIYNLGKKNDDIQPYFGGGAGAYFYDLKDNLGDIESGTEFGFHLLGGARAKITEDFYVVGEYNKHFVSPVFFNNAEDFNHSTLTLGASIFFPVKAKTSSTTYTRKTYRSEPDTYSDYRFNKYEEDLLLEIVQLKTEIKEMTKRRDDLREEVDSFYEEYEYDEYDSEFEKKYNQIKFKEKKIQYINREIKEAQKKLSELRREWRTLRKDNQPIEKHIVYLEKNYTYSPHGIYLIKGYYTRHNRPYKHRYYRRLRKEPKGQRRIHQRNMHQKSNDYYEYKEEKKEKPSKKQSKEEYIEKRKEHIRKLKNR